MGLTAKALLHPRKREDGTHQVRVRLTKDRVVAFLDAGFTVALVNWNDKPTAHLNKSWVKTADTNAKSRNNTLRQLLDDADEMARQSPLLTSGQVRDLLARSIGVAKAPKQKPREDGAPTDVVAFADWYVRARARTDKPNTVKFYRETANSLARWRDGEALPFSALCPAHLAELHAWLIAQPTIFAGTARDRLVKLSTIIKRAEKLGLVAAGKNPFTDFELPKVGNKNPPRRPTDDERRAVLSLDLDAQVFDFHIHKNFRQDLIVRRDIWHLQYLIRGSRCGDILQLRERDVRPEQISFTEIKTGKLKGTGRTPAINAVLARYPASGNPLAYVLPALDSTAAYATPNPSQSQLEALSYMLRDRVQWVNAGLKRLSELAGVPAFTSHSARHMFLERAYVKTKDMRLVQKMANHAAIGTTESYISTLGYSALDAATESILSDD